MKSVKVPVGVIVFVALLVVALVVYMFYQNSKVAEDVVANDRIKLENERLNLLAQFNISKQIEDFQIREPIGFQIT